MGTIKNKKKLDDNDHLDHIELEFNSNKDLNILLGENSKNLDKLNKILDVNISFFGNRLTIIGKKTKIDKAKKLIKKIHEVLLQDKKNKQSFDFSIFESELKMLENENFIDSSVQFLNSIDTWKKKFFQKIMVKKNI